MTVLVVADHTNTALSEATPRVVSAGSRLSADVDVLVCGQAAAPAAEAAARLTGVRTVLLAESEALGHHIAEAIASTVAALATGYEAIILAATSSGKNSGPRIAAKLDVNQITDVIEIKSADTFVRPIYAGNALETVQSFDTIKVMVIRPTAFSPCGQDGSAPVEIISATDPSGRTAAWVEETMMKSDRPELAGARIVVSGGRALGSAAEFKRVIEPLADALGAAVGASRAAVDAGYASNDHQVGQTGKVVAPELYVAVGISGAIQHLAGMKDSKTIVAINKDPDAPIFAVADYGLVGDYKVVVPELLETLGTVK